MKIVFRERKRKKTKHESLKKILVDTLNKYIEPDIIDELDIEVFLGPMESCGLINEYGCLPYRKFRIAADNRKPIWRIRQTIRHETIHIKQVVNGEQIPTTSDFRTLWKGEDHTDTDYYDCPWEIEAYELENIR